MINEDQQLFQESVLALSTQSINGTESLDDYLHFCNQMDFYVASVDAAFSRPIPRTYPLFVSLFTALDLYGTSVVSDAIAPLVNGIVPVSAVYSFIESAPVCQPEWYSSIAVGYPSLRGLLLDNYRRMVPDLRRLLCICQIAEQTNTVPVAIKINEN